MPCRELRFVLSVVFYVVNENPQNRIRSKSCRNQKKTPEIRRFQVLFGAAGQIRTADLILTNCRRAFQPLLFKAFRQFFVQKGRGRSLFVPLFPSMCFPVWVTVWVKQTPLRQRSRGQASPSYFVLPFLSHN